MESKTKELVKAGHELVVLLGNQHGMIDAASLVQRLTAQLDITAAALKQSLIDSGCYKRGMEESSERLVQLAADNLNLKSLIADGCKWDGEQWVGLSVETPATDAWQREQLRAGVAPQKPILSQAITDIIAERQRQKESKGYTESRDDNYLPGVLNLAGAAYAVSASCLPDAKRRADRLWPWPDAGKYLNASSKDPRSALIKAAALITAEIERIDRAQLRNGEVV